MNRQDVIDHLKIIRTWATVGKDPIYRGIEPKCCEDVEKWIDDALALLKAQEPKVPIHIHEEYPEHDWEKDKNGKVDEFAFDYGYHNGPVCKRCGYSFCMHCKPNGWNEEPCVIDYYQCPKCGTHIIKNDREILYCERCGQAVTWGD